MIGIILVLVGIILLMALFCSAEIAFVMVNMARLVEIFRGRVKLITLVKEFHSNPEKFLSTVLVGTNVCVVSFSILLADVFFIHSGIGEGVLGSLAASLVVLVFGEIIPKSLARVWPEYTAGLLAPFLWFVRYLLYPLILVVNFASRVILRWFGVSSTARYRPMGSRQDLQLAFRESSSFLRGYGTYVPHIFSFTNLRAWEVMVPRVEITAIPEDSTVGDVLNVVAKKGYSILPVYRGDMDGISGVVRVKDIFSVLPPLDTPVCDFVRAVRFVPGTKHCENLLLELSEDPNHMAVVVDEYGGVMGLVTLEDLLEELVGEIRDEFDEEEPEVRKIGEHAYIVDGQVRLDILRDVYNIGLKPVSEEYDTIAGLVFAVLGRVPVEGESVEVDGWCLTVEDMQENRINRIRIEAKR
mgnify:CR=1 FL=1